MVKNIKKMMSALLVFVLLFSIVPTMTLNVEAKAETEDITSLMLDLGIYSNDDDMIYDKELITREEMASILSVFYGITEESCPEPTSFEDVSENWSSGHINAMVDNGIMSGYSDGLFRPHANVTGDMVIKTLVTMTGYGVLAEAKGGYPGGYYAVAMDLGLLKGLGSFNRGENITRGAFTKILYNSLSVPLLEIESVGENIEYSKKTGENLLSDRLDIYCAKGVVKALPYVGIGLGNAVAGKGKIHIDNTEYLCDLDAYPYLGNNVEVYYRQSKDDSLGKVLHISDAKGNDNCIEVQADDIVSYKNYKFNYTVNGKSRSISIPADVTVVFNGKTVPYFKAEHLMPPQGTVKFCDTDGNNSYDVVIVEYEIDYRVSSVSKEENLVYISDANGKNFLKIDLGKNYHTTTDKGLPYDITKLKKDDVISVTADVIKTVSADGKDVVSFDENSTVYRIKRSNRHITGKVTGIDEDGIISVDGTDYELSATLYNKEVILDTNYTFYLNYMGQITDFSAEKGAESYGILVLAANEGKLSKKTKVKIFTEDDMFRIYDCSENLRIDGYKKANYGNALTKLKETASEYANKTGMKYQTDSVWQVIKYAENPAGELASIDTVVENVTATETDFNHFGTKASGVGSTWILGTLGVTSTPQARYGVALDAKYFLVDSAALDKEESYRALPINEMYGGIAAVNFFDTDEANLSHLVVKTENNTFSIIDGNLQQKNLMVVENTKVAFDSEGNAWDTVCGLNLRNGQSVSIKLTSAQMLDGVEPGDLIHWREDRDGVAIAVDKALVRSGYENGVHTANNGWCGVFYDSICLRYGKAMYYGQSFFTMGYDMKDGSFMEEPLTTSLSQIATFIFDTETNRISQTTLDTVRTAKDFGIENADYVVLYCTNAVPTHAVIYR